MSRVDYNTQEALYLHAKKAAKKAANDYLEEFGHKDCCGYAWVRITSARGKFVNYLKHIGVGRDDKPGYVISDPANTQSQALTAKEKGAAAFAEVLCEAGIDAYLESRMD